MWNPASRSSRSPSRPGGAVRRLELRPAARAPQRIHPARRLHDVGGAARALMFDPLHTGHAEACGAGSELRAAYARNALPNQEGLAKLRITEPCWRRIFSAGWRALCKHESLPATQGRLKRASKGPILARCHLSLSSEGERHQAPLLSTHLPSELEPTGS